MQKIKELISKAESNEKYGKYVQFIKFGIVGVSNTLISYSIEMLCFYVLFANVSWPENTKILVTSILAFVVSVTNSYYWNNRYVFKSGSRKTFKTHLWAYLKTVLCYGVTGLVLGPWLKVWLNQQGIAYWLASLMTLLITIPLNFLLNKFWAFNGKGENK